MDHLAFKLKKKKSVKQVHSCEQSGTVPNLSSDIGGKKIIIQGFQQPIGMLCIFATQTSCRESYGGNVSQALHYADITSRRQIEDVSGCVSLCMRVGVWGVIELVTKWFNVAGGNCLV